MSAPSSSPDNHTDSGCISSLTKDDVVPATLPRKETSEERQEREGNKKVNKSDDNNGSPLPSIQDKKQQQIATSGTYHCNNDNQKGNAACSQLPSSASATATASASYDSPGERDHDVSSTEMIPNPYLHKQVRILSGQFEG